MIMKSSKYNLGRMTSLATAAAALSGCAVTTLDVEKEATQSKAEMAAIQPAGGTSALAPKSGLRKMDGNFLGANPIETSSATKLPGHLRDVTLSFGSGSIALQQAAANITKATGVPVRIATEVFKSPGSAMARVVAEPTPAASAGAPMPSPLPSTGLPVSASQSQSAPQDTGFILASFRGDLADYLTYLAARTESSWSYENGEILFYRLTTRRMQVAISPGALTYRDDVSSGGEGGGGESKGTSFASSASVSVSATIDPWKGLENTLMGMLSGEGRLIVNQASSTVVVTDLKANVDRIEKHLALENALATRQVRVEMREILVQETGESSAGLDVSVIYNRFLDAGLSVDGLSGAKSPNYSINTSSPASLVGSTSGAMRVDFTREGYFQGSNLIAKALNGVGRVVSNSSRTIITTNRVPGRVQDVTDRAYLAETKPSAGGTGSTGGAGVPGLTPGTVTYGDNIAVVPTIRDNGEVLMQLFSTRSSLIELSSVSAGEGATFQQINTPVLNRKKFSQSFRIRDGQTMVIVSNVSSTLDSSDRTGITGGSTTANRSKIMSVLLVTPYVLGQ